MVREDRKRSENRREQMLKYLMGNKKSALYSDLTDFYGWHISDLAIYDKPKELSDFTGLKQTRFGGMPHALNRPPQSWYYVEEKTNEID